MSSKLDTLVRVGYVAKGVIYGLIGVLAVGYVLGLGGRVTDTEGAIRTIGAQPLFGYELLLATAIGLGLYAMWRFLDGALDFEHRGKDLVGIVRRIGCMSSGLSYAALAYYGFSLALGMRHASGTPSKHELTTRLLQTEWGPWVLAVIGLVMIAAGAFYLSEGLRGKFMEHYERAKMSAAAWRSARVLGTIGIAARAIAFFIIGGFIIRAAERSNAHEVKGLGEALRTLAEGSAGRVLLIVVAVGFVAYGIYCFACAWYRRFELRPAN